MSFVPISDLARSMVGREMSTLLKNRQSQLTQELTTGQVADPVRFLKGNLANVSSLSRNDLIQTEFIQHNRELSQMAEAVSLALNTVSDSLGTLLDVVVIGPQSNLASVAEIGREQAKNSLSTIVSALGTNVAGRHLFSGNDVTTPPLAAPQQILDAIDNVVSGESSSAGIIARIDDFFDPGGGFETAIYQGGSEDVEPHRISEKETVSLALRADDQSLRDVMKSAAYVFASASPNVTLTPEEQRTLLSSVRDFTFQSKDALLETQGKIGLAESRIEDAIVRLQSQKTATEKSRADLLGIDTFEVATRLEDVNSRLELLYATTARSARLSFLDYMR